MTPFELSILIHYHVSPTDFRDGDFQAPALREVIDNFAKSGFLRLSMNDETASSIYRATEKTNVFVEALCAVPEPVQQWIIPGGDTP